MREYQKKNPVMAPFRTIRYSIESLFTKKDTTPTTKKTSEINPFRMSKRDADLLGTIKGKIAVMLTRKPR